MKRTAMRVVSSSLDVCADVGMDRLNLVCLPLSRPGAVAEWDIENRSEAITKTLTAIKQLAASHGHEQVRVVVEPTGVYHAHFLNIARRLDFELAFVNPEHVEKMRHVIFGDGGKSDERDPHAISAVASQGRTIVVRPLPDTYQLLRHWGRLYGESEAAIITQKSRVHRVLKLLFPDFDFTTDFLYGPSGRAIMRCFHFNPHRIAALTRSRLQERLRRHSRVTSVSVDRLLTQARATVKTTSPDRTTEAIERELVLVWEELELHERRREEARSQLEQLYAEARAADPKLPDTTGVISICAMARLLGELGPLSDYSGAPALQKMAGLNLCERKSGTYKGLTKIARSGRRGARAILNQIALALVRRDRLFGPYYHRKRGVEKMPGKKAMTAVARKLLKMIWGWYNSAGGYDAKRVFTCQSAHTAAA